MVKLYNCGLRIVDCGLRLQLRIARFAALIGLVLASCRQVAPLPESALRDLTSIDQFRDAFNADASRPRLLLIVAPT
jgi:hypothetical protein